MLKCKNLSRVSSVEVKAQSAASAVKVPLQAANKVKLGSSDLLASIVCLGTMTWGVQNTEADAHSQLSYAFDSGINFLDTAEMYPIPPTKETQGSTDRFIGTWLKTRKREDVIIATKVSGFSDRTYLRDPPRSCRVKPDQIQESVNRSLERLQTDYIDLLQIHWPDRYVPLWGSSGYDVKREYESVPFEEQLLGLQNVIKSGKVRYIGVSNETSYGVSEFVRCAREIGLPKISTIQNLYNLVTRVPFETDLAEMCRRHNVALLAYSPLAGGSLSGKYNRSEQSKGRLNLFPGYMERYKASLVKDAVAEYEKIAEKYGMTATQLALAWVKSRWFVTSTIIGATTMEQLKENIEAFNMDLSDEAIADIQGVFKRYRDPTLS